MEAFSIKTRGLGSGFVLRHGMALMQRLQRSWSGLEGAMDSADKGRQCQGYSAALFSVFPAHMGLGRHLKKV